MTTNLGCPLDTQQSQVGSFGPFFKIWDIEDFLEGYRTMQSNPNTDKDINVTDSLDLTVYSVDIPDYICLGVSEVREDGGAVSACSTVDNSSDLRRS